VLFVIAIALAAALLLVRRVGGKDREGTLPT
jgi:hypothetical protein